MKRLIHTLTHLLIDTTDPTPAHGDPWLIQPTETGYEWACLECVATGADPSETRARAAARGHYRAAHVPVGAL